METLIKKINIYSFKELSEKVQATVIDEMIQNTEFFDDFSMEVWNDKLLEFGFNNPIINYTGFGSQGDGASFTSDHINILLFIKNKPEYRLLKWAIRRGLLEFDCTVYRHNHNYYHDDTCSIDMDYQIDEYEREISTHLLRSIENKINDLKNDLEYVRSELSIEIYQDLKNDYYYQTEPDNIIQMILDNDYKFLENGEIYNEV